MENLVAVQPKVDVYGYAAYIKLVEIRVIADIQRAQAELDKEQVSIQHLRQDNTSWFGGIKISRSESKINKIKNSISMKNYWLIQWRKANWIVIEGKTDTSRLKDMQVCDLLTACDNSENHRLKRYLVMQDAVLAPVYQPLPGFPILNDINELNLKEGCALVAKNAGYDPNTGITIHDNTVSFMRECAGFWQKVITWTTIGALGLAGIAALAAGPLAAAIGGLMGLSGAAAVSSGLALLGGGSLVSGGLGMAGGLAVLMGSGALVGGSGFAGIAQKIAALPKEVLVLELAKNINYVSYLSTGKLKNIIKAGEVRDLVITNFLNMKHSTEKDILLKHLSSSEKTKALESIRFMNLALVKMAESMP